ncbi:hypothetical protein J0H58_22020 [bacterium]|nr:hypothetical protein [bacterium]
MTLPTADWLAALADMDAALAAAVAGLDAYEARWPEPPPGRGEESPPREFEQKLATWGERLLAAGRLAEELERGFAEQTSAVGRWREAFTTWQRAIQQPAAPTP